VSLRCEVSATDLVEQDGQQLALLRIDNPTRPRSVLVSYRVGGRADSMSLKIPHGRSSHWIRFPAATTSSLLRAEIDGQILRARVQPARTWTIHLVNHTHTDLGYTDYQPNIDRSFYEFLLEAMALVEQTSDFPEPARYRWTIETVYHLRNFQRFASRRELRALLSHLRRGTIEATAGFAQMTDLPSADQVLRSFRFIHDFARRHRIPLATAMACDINGLPWVYPAALHDLGARNLSMAINNDMARCPLKRPMPFWWESPDGKRILVWHGECYLLGNRFGVERSVEHSLDGVAGYLAELARRDYPYDHVLILMSGARMDCAPPTIGPSLTVRDWNRRFANPTMRMATLAEWFAQVRRMLDEHVPVYRGHWPDYWAHGLGSAVDEVRYARETQHLLSAAGIASSYVRATDRSWRVPTALDQAYDDAEIAAEHTWGAACSIERPYADFAKIQWQYKRDHFYRARLDSQLALDAALERIGRAAVPDTASVVVYNPLAWPRGGIAELDSVQRPLPGYCIERLVDAESGRVAPYYRAEEQNPLEELRVPIRNVPATGYVTLLVQNGQRNTLEWAPVSGRQNLLENKYYRLRVNARSGEIEEIYDKQVGRNLVRSYKGLAFGRIIEEELPSPEARHWTNRADRAERFRRGVFKRYTATARALRRAELHGILQEITFAGKCHGLTGVTTTIRLHEREKRIDLIWRLNVAEHPDPQAAYVAFPFPGAKPRVWLEVPGAAMEPSVDQIPTTCYDFYTVQNFVRIETGPAAVTLVPRDTPLVQLNEVSTFHFREKLPHFNGSVVAWLFNNYWHTNFPASQPGEHLFHFSLTSGRPRTHDLAASYRFAYEVANPLRARFLSESPLQHATQLHRRPFCGSFVQIEPSNVILLSIGLASDASGHVFRLQETAGKPTRVALRFPELKPRRVARSDLYGGNPRPVRTRGGTVRLAMAPRELATVKVDF
jgi:alpha-mannosidase